MDLWNKKINSNSAFIGSWIMENSQICVELIDYFEINKTKQLVKCIFSRKGFKI